MYVEYLQIKNKIYGDLYGIHVLDTIYQLTISSTAFRKRPHLCPLCDLGVTFSVQSALGSHGKAARLHVPTEAHLSKYVVSPYY